MERKTEDLTFPDSFITKRPHDLVLANETEKKSPEAREHSWKNSPPYKIVTGRKNSSLPAFLGYDDKNCKKPSSNVKTESLR